MTTPTPTATLQNRRRLLGWLAGTPLAAGALSSSMLPRTAAAQNAGCTLTPSMTEGPFFVDEKLNRSDLTTGTTQTAVSAGLPLLLNIQLVNAACQPLSGVQVDIWHTHALGLYSDIGSGQAGGITTGEKYLRGYQISDASGHVSFRTIYPGYYNGRTAHIHVKARAYDAAGNRTHEFNSQLYFSDALSDVVYQQVAPYSGRVARTTRNSNDGIYNAATEMVLTARTDGAGYIAAPRMSLALAASVSSSKALQGQLTGAWYDPTRSGEGVQVEISTVATRNVAFITWFTYLAGVQQWLAGSADFAEGATMLDIPLSVTRGTGFGSAFASAQVIVTAWGSVKIEFKSCDQLLLSYSGNGQTGSLTLQRAVGPLKGIGCV